MDKNVPGGQPSYYDMISDSLSSSKGYKISSFPLWPSHSYLLNCYSCNLGIGLSSAIKRRLGVKDRDRAEGTVAVIVRTHSRRMGGLKTGKLSEVVEEVRASEERIEATVLHEQLLLRVSLRSSLRYRMNSNSSATLFARRCRFLLPKTVLTP